MPVWGIFITGCAETFQPAVKKIVKKATFPFHVGNIQNREICASICYIYFTTLVISRYPITIISDYVIIILMGNFRDIIALLFGFVDKLLDIQRELDRNHKRFASYKYAFVFFVLRKCSLMDSITEKWSYADSCRKKMRYHETADNDVLENKFPLSNFQVFSQGDVTCTSWPVKIRLATRLSVCSGKQQQKKSNFHITGSLLGFCYGNPPVSGGFLYRWNPLTKGQ